MTEYCACLKYTHLARRNEILALLLILACIMTHHCIVSSICAYDHMTGVSLELNHLKRLDQGIIEPNIQFT